MNRSSLAIALAICFAVPSIAGAQKTTKKPDPLKPQRDEIKKLRVENDLAEQKLKTQMRAQAHQLKKLQAKQRLAREKHNAAVQKMELEQKKLSVANRLAAERAKTAAAAQKAALDKLKAETAALRAKTSLAKAKQAEQDLAYAAVQAKQRRELGQMRYEAMKLKHSQTKVRHNYSRYSSALLLRKARKAWRDEANSNPDRRRKPFKGGKLIISDRRIPLNGPIMSGVGKYVDDRINFYNNISTKDPIFIVIDNCPGGSVMEGYRIVQSMLHSKAPVHVVVKSFAASMAAVITTLAKHSYAYPNAIILHHEMRTFQFGSMTELKERYAMAKKWERRLMGPVARKLGITIAQFRKRMYQNNSNGDWQEFANKAKQLKWVQNVVTTIHETGIVKKPQRFRRRFRFFLGGEKTDTKGRAYVNMPRLSPLDLYYMYNPDKYYR